MGFDIDSYRDQTAAQIQDVIARKAKDGTLKDYNSLAVCLLSHGDSESVCGTDFNSAAIHHLQYAFNSHDCPEMHDKPKIFIVQACRDPKIHVTETASKNYRIISCSKITINVPFVSERGFNRCT